MVGGFVTIFLLGVYAITQLEGSSGSGGDGRGESTRVCWVYGVGHTYSRGAREHHPGPRGFHGV